MIFLFHIGIYDRKIRTLLDGNIKKSVFSTPTCICKKIYQWKIYTYMKIKKKKI